MLLASSVSLPLTPISCFIFSTCILPCPLWPAPSSTSSLWSPIYHQTGWSWCREAQYMHDESSPRLPQCPVGPECRHLIERSSSFVIYGNIWKHIYLGPRKPRRIVILFFALYKYSYVLTYMVLPWHSHYVTQTSSVEYIKYYLMLMNIQCQKFKFALKTLYFTFLANGRDLQLMETSGWRWSRARVDCKQQLPI